MTVPLPAVGAAELRAYLGAMELARLAEMARDPDTPVAVQRHVGEVLASRLSLDELHAAIYGRLRAPAYSHNGTRVKRWPPRVLQALRDTLTAYQRHTPATWGRLTPLRGLARVPAPDQRPPMEHPPAVVRRETVRYLGREMAAADLQQVYQQTATLLEQLRQPTGA